MNPQELFLKKEVDENVFDYIPAQVWYCGKCKIIYSNETLAKECCLLKTCKCGEKCEKYYLSCPKCVKEQETVTEKQKLNKAKKIDIKDYTGFILDGEYAHDDWDMFFDNYFENCDFACPECKGETEQNDGLDKIHSFLSCKCGWESPKFEIINDIYYLFAPEYIWAADFKPLELDIDNILESVLDDHHETVSEYYKGGKELKIAIDNFNEANKSVGSYNESNKLALINIKEFVKEIYE